MSKPVLTVVGGGMGDAATLTAEGTEAIRTAKRALAPPRLAEAFRELNGSIITAGIPETLAALENNSGDAVVIVSGDCGFYSLAALLRERLRERYALRLLPGISSLQYFCALLGTAWQDVKAVSLHGRAGSLAGPVSYNNKVFALAGGENGTGEILCSLEKAGLGFVTAHVGENLGAAAERIVSDSVEALASGEYAGLSVLLLENLRPGNPGARLRDDDFMRGGTPMTKEEVRVLAVSRLEVAPRHTVWDIGAGTGSVSTALAYAACEGEVFAVERDAEALGLLRENREKLGAYNMQVVEGEAPSCLEGLPIPDRVFVGGSGGQLRELLELLTKLPGGRRVCVTAIVLETLSAALEALRELGWADIELSCINVSRAKAAGSLHMMIAQNPVYIISAELER
ncbi:MAG: precorrin-6y C5,15-methyltransferase (decarboxylating) subunit CbiE [Oscillospiraceae bacterium]